MQARKVIVPILIGLLILIISVFGLTQNVDDRQKIFIELVKDLGVLVIGLSIVEFVWYLVGGAPTDLALDELRRTSNEIKTVMKSDLDELRTQSRDTLTQLHAAIDGISNISLVAKSSGRIGLVDIGESQDKLGYAPSAFVQDIRSAHGAIDVMGVTLNIIYGYDSVCDALKDKADAGIPVRILLPDPEGDHLTDIFDDRFKSEIVLGSSALIELIKSKYPKVQVKKLEKKVITMSFIRVDDTAIVSPYLHSSQSPESPRIRVKGRDSPLMRIYCKEFDTLWRDAASI